MKTARTEISLEQMNVICEGLASAGYDALDTFEGVLLDSVFYDLGENPGLRLGRTHLRRYLMITEYYINPNSSGLLLTMTDSERLFYSTLESYQTARAAYEAEAATA